MREYNFKWKYESMFKVIAEGEVTLDSTGKYINSTGSIPPEKVIDAARFMKNFMDFKNSVLTLDGYTITANL